MAVDDWFWHTGATGREQDPEREIERDTVEAELRGGRHRVRPGNGGDSRNVPFRHRPFGLIQGDEQHTLKRGQLPDNAFNGGAQIVEFAAVTVSCRRHQKLWLDL